ncbi:hypothetical protein NPIL_386771 [Nephila pilipes]|uniref:Uncharacterized protein n=1 Tax=Nephila pilipes TaxID=299642 RepID=A0A8X6PV64_NEPPI|nr:hypothetical protein NPIL_386771 [Nephila pilipes]
METACNLMIQNVCSTRNFVCKMESTCQSEAMTCIDGFLSSFLICLTSGTKHLAQGLKYSSTILMAEQTVVNMRQAMQSQRSFRLNCRRALLRPRLRPHNDSTFFWLLHLARRIKDTERTICGHIANGVLRAFGNGSSAPTATR